MSGHSHAKTVARTKQANAEKKGAAFSKLARIIALTAKDGPDPASNSKLRAAIDTAKKFNMPKDNIERAIKKGSGPGEGVQLEEVLYEALGPNNIALIIEGIAENKNRSYGEIKQILQKYNYKIANEGSVKWQFEQKGVILIKSEKNEGLELKAIEAGAEDFKWFSEENETYLEINTKAEDLDKVKKNMESQGLEIDSAILGWVAKDEIEAMTGDKEKLDKLCEDLDDSETSQNVYSNTKN